MAVSASYRILFLSACVIFASAQPGESGRGFVVVQGSDNETPVDQVVKDTLQSGLTTVFLPIIYIIVFAMGLPTNAMAIWVLLFRSKKIHPSTIYMGNLALADLMFVIWTPLKIAYHLKGNNWTYGEGMCKVLVGFFYGNMYCSILFITCLSVQRYWVCAHPLSQHKKNNKFAIIVSVCIWIFIWVSTTPLYLYQQTFKSTELNITTCHDINFVSQENYQTENMFLDVQLPYYYFMVMAGLVFFIPMLVIIAAYVLLLRLLGNSAVEGSAGKTRQRAVVLIVTVLITFLVCFIPSNVMLVLHYSVQEKSWANKSYGLYITTLCLASLNSCLDPFIYYYVSDEFREHVKNTLLCRSSRTVDRMRVSFSSMKYSKKKHTYTSSTGPTESSSC
ncbi:coagulation factor II (thrombin) receptor-like 1, tandem duplicate 2 [Rhinichthys klamathensis goyatoka]|uniref:coagulation factor II (thrombin) receptor-like 1, tandem duplicate 2 n=1 Tax=Rhinichthys klamathensis goyatoka TaxID=3034132 RepID=UPI0024B622FC|nr:coagulation factor II (thrombin) receptor-like 1, tandem duplicate 2 [Rhinichthys klamathensis goyatoka]